MSDGFMRKIIHIDMDAYYAAIEIREDPSLKGKCVIVGGSPNSRGVVTTCSYEARKYGVHSGMPSSRAWRLCPKGIFIRTDFPLYKQVSSQIREVFYNWTDKVEPVSLDEAYLDVTENKHGEDSAETIAQKIKDEIFSKTRLTCSAGVSFNKFLAKIGSDFQKPDGLTVIDESRAQEILFSLPIEKFHGIGKVTAAKMRKLGIYSGKELYGLSINELVAHFGKVGLFYYNVVRGIDRREVVSDWEPKSISCENTFSEDIGDLDGLIQWLKRITERLAGRMQKQEIMGSLINIKLKYANFEVITRSMQLPHLTDDEEIIYSYAEQLLIANWDSTRPVRLLGVGLGKLDNEESDEQLTLDF